MWLSEVVSESPDLRIVPSKCALSAEAALWISDTGLLSFD